MESFYRGKAVLVTGGAGVIGTELIKMLLAQGARILCVDLQRRPEDLDPAVTYIQGDANHLTREAVRHFAPEVCVHLAATFERAIETEDFWSENFWHNVRLSHYIMTLLKNEPKLRRVIFASSYLIYNSGLYMFSEPQDQPFLIDESTPIAPRNICGAAKLLHEIELRFLTSFPSASFTSISARIFRVYGKGSRDIASRWVRSLLQQPQAPLTVYGKEAMFDYIYAGDVAEGLLRLGATDALGIVNLGTGHARRVEELLDALQGHFPDLKRIEHSTDIPYEAHQADLTRLLAICGWRPGTSIEQGLGILKRYESAEMERSGQRQSLQQLPQEQQPPPQEPQQPQQPQQPQEPQTAAPAVLLTSVSRKVTLVERYQSAMRALAQDGKIWGGDTDSGCVASHFVDEFWNMPQLNALATDDLISFCHNKGIRLIVPTRDGELMYFANRRDQLQEAGIMVMIGAAGGVEACLDKLHFDQHCRSRSLPSIPTYASLAELLTAHPDTTRLVVKERFGAGSRALGLDLTPALAQIHAAQLDTPVFQPFVTGTEYSIDLYVNQSGQLMDVVPRVRVQVHAGESVITETCEHPDLVRVSALLCEAFSLRGHAVLQAFDTPDGLQLIECNPRVGGASALSFEAGLTTPVWSVLEAIGQSITPQPGAYRRGLRLVRASKDIFVEA